MDYFGEQPKFEIQPVIEQSPFESHAVRSFFQKWCGINGSPTLQIVNRQTWEHRGVKGILEERPNGKQTLYVPKDLQLWEMVGVMEVVDQHTFTTKPERQSEKKVKLVVLGKLFQNSGAYIAKRLDSIEQGKEIARALAEEFYDYGLSLEHGKRPEQPSTFDTVLSRNLTREEIEAVDRFLAGEHLYAARRARAEKSGETDTAKRDELYETERQKTLAQFFRVAQKAFELKQKTGHHEGVQVTTTTDGLELWQLNPTSIHSTFLAKIEKAITKEIETPKREFESAIFRRGLEKLVGEMKESKDMYEKRTGEVILGWKNALSKFLIKVGFNPLFEQRKLADIINITQLRTELEVVRQTGDPSKISAKEREITDKIQKAVGSFPYRLDSNNPAEMVANQYINCVGASTLGGALMKEARLNYLVGAVPEHSILFLVTEDGRVEWRDMLRAKSNEDLTDEMIVGKKQDESSLTVADISAFSRNPKPEGLMFDISPKYREKMNWVREGERQYVAIFEPEYGQQLQVLNNTAVTLLRLRCYKEAVEAYRRVIALDPKIDSSYRGLNLALRELRRYKEAIEVEERARGLK